MYTTWAKVLSNVHITPTGDKETQSVSVLMLTPELLSAHLQLVVMDLFI